MNLLPLLFLINISPIQEPKVKRLNDLDQIEILNSIDDFKQYHTNSFKVNLFRRVSAENKELNGFPLVNFIIGVVNYSEMESPKLFEVGDFHRPQITNSIRRAESLTIMIEYGEDPLKRTLVLSITKEGVRLSD